MPDGELLEELASRGLRLKGPKGLKRLQEYMDCSFASIRRRDIEILMEWCHDKGGHFLDRADDSETWLAFAPKARVLLFAGCDEHNQSLREDLKVQDYVLAFVSERRCRTKGPIVAERHVERVRHAMRTANCIFVGSPKSNPASEIAWSLLFGAVPFDPSADNRAQIPIRFVSAHWPAYVNRYASVEAPRDGEKEGLLLEPAAGVRTTLAVPWLPLDDFRRGHGRSFDAGALLVVHQPLGTAQTVTTMIIAGYTSYATTQIGHDVAREFVPMGPTRGRPGEPVVRITSVPYKTDRGSLEREPAPTPAWYTIESAVSAWPALLKARPGLTIPKRSTTR